MTPLPEPSTVRSPLEVGSAAIVCAWMAWAASAAHADVFRCEINGRMTYQQTPCSEAGSARGSVETPPPSTPRGHDRTGGAARASTALGAPPHRPRPDAAGAPRPTGSTAGLSPEARAAQAAVEEALVMTGHRRLPAPGPRPAPALPLSPPLALPANCDFPWRPQLPADFEVHVVAAAGGKLIPEPIDDSGSVAGLLEVDVNSPARPIALVLVADHPTVWNLRRTAGTRIVGIWASGYHQPLVAGAGADVPVVVSNVEKQTPCATGTIARAAAHPLAKMAFGREATLYHDLVGGRRASIGPPLSDRQVLRFEGPPYQALISADLKPGGQAGLARLEAQGLLRRATMHDVVRWRTWTTACTPPPPMAPLAQPVPPRPDLVPWNAWVVLKSMAYPPGLHGGHAAHFYVFKDVPTPTGDPGHSTVLDANKVSCRGS